MGVALLIIGCCVITINTITMIVKQDTRFPSFVGFPYKDRVSNCLYLSHIGEGDNPLLTYRRPDETGMWHLEASYNEEKQLVVRYGSAEHLVGKTLVPVRSKEFLQDNQGVNRVHFMREITLKEFINSGNDLDNIDVSTIRTLLFKRGDVTKIKHGGITPTGNLIASEGIFEGKPHKDIDYSFNVWCLMDI